MCCSLSDVPNKPRGKAKNDLEAAAAVLLLGSSGFGFRAKKVAVTCQVSSHPRIGKENNPNLNIYKVHGITKFGSKES
jgi:hypothetical protein